MGERHEPGAPAAPVRRDRLPLPHDPPPPPGYVDPLGEGGVLSDLTITTAGTDASGVDTDEDARSARSRRRH